MRSLLAAAAAAYTPPVGGALGPYGISDVPVINGELALTSFTYDAADPDDPDNNITAFNGGESTPVVWENAQGLSKTPELASNLSAWNGRPVISFDGTDFLDHQATSVGGVNLVCESTNAFSVIQTFLPETLNGGYLLSRAGIDVAARMFGVWLNGDMRIYIGGATSSVSGTQPSTTVPNIYFFVWNGTTAKIHLNSGAMRVSPTIGTASNPAAGFRLGARMADSTSLFTTSAGYGYRGDLGNFHVWDKALSLADANTVRAGMSAYYGDPSGWGAFT